MSWDGHTGVDEGECVVPTVKGQAVVFPSFKTDEEGCSYVRFIRQSDLKELLYYSVTEWMESESQAKEVMGCIMAAIQNGAKDE